MRKDDVFKVGKIIFRVLEIVTDALDKKEDEKKKITKKPFNYTIDPNVSNNLLLERSSLIPNNRLNEYDESNRKNKVTNIKEQVNM